jgi:hypothetical protein
MACGSCGKKYPGAPQLTPEQREEAKAVLAARREAAAVRSGAALKPGAPRGYRPPPAAPGGGPGSPEKLLVKGKR